MNFVRKIPGVGYHRLDPCGARSEAVSLPWPDGTLIVVVLAVELLLFDIFLYCYLCPGGQLSFLFQRPRAAGLSFLEIRTCVNVLLWVFALAWLLIGGIRNRGPRGARWAAYALTFTLLGGQQLITASWGDTCEWGLMVGRRDLGRGFWGTEVRSEYASPVLSDIMIPVTPLTDSWPQGLRGSPCVLAVMNDEKIWAGRECLATSDDPQDLELLRGFLQEASARARGAEEGPGLVLVLQADMNASFQAVQRILRTLGTLAIELDEVLLASTAHGDRWEEHLGFVPLRLVGASPAEEVEAIGVRVIERGTKHSPTCRGPWRGIGAFRYGWDRRLGYSFRGDDSLSLQDLAAAVDEALRAGGAVRFAPGRGVTVDDMLRLFEALPSWQPEGVLLGMAR